MQKNYNKEFTILKKINDFVVVFAVHERLDDTLFITYTDILIGDNNCGTKTTLGMLMLIGQDIDKNDKYEPTFNRIGRIREYFINALTGNKNADTQEQIEKLLIDMNDLYKKYKKEILWDNILGKFLSPEVVDNKIYTMQNKYKFIVKEEKRSWNPKPVPVSLDSISTILDDL